MSSRVPDQDFDQQVDVTITLTMTVNSRVPADRIKAEVEQKLASLTDQLTDQLWSVEDARVTTIDEEGYIYTPTDSHRLHHTYPTFTEELAVQPPRSWRDLAENGPELGS